MSEKLNYIEDNNQINNDSNTPIEALPESQEKHKDTVMGYIERSGLNDKEKVEELIQNGNYQDFKVHLVRLNALVRNLLPEEHSIDGTAVLLPDALVPISSEYKEQVVEQAFDSLKNINPKDRGILMYNILGNAHLFEDGNGRCMRIMHHILIGEPLTEESINTMVEHDNNSQNGYGKNGRVEIQNYLEDNSFYTNGIINILSNYSALDKLDVDNIRSTFPWLDPIFDDETIKTLPIEDINRIKLICKNDTGAQYCPNNIITMHMLSLEDESFITPPAAIEGDDYMYDTESNDSITLNTSQAKRFIEINNELKLKQFGVMIDIFQKPEDYKTPNGNYYKEWFYKK